MKLNENTLARYAERRDLIISTEKTKILRFSKSGMKSKNAWFCGGTQIEEVKTFVYLGFCFQSNDRFSEQIKMLADRGKARVSSVWSIGEQNWKNNFFIRR